MNELEIFKNEEFGEIRTVEQNGQIFFVANDIAKILGYKNPSDATNKHCRNAIMAWGSDSLGRRQEFKMIPESDLYRLIISSKLPSAEKFEKWVFEEVLPTIRKTGTYTKPVDNRPTEVILSEALLIAKDTMEKQTQAIAELEDRNGRLDRKIEEDAPKVEQFERFINSKGLYTLRDTAKLLNYPPNALNNLLIENGYLFRTGHKGKLSAYQTRLRQGIFKLKTFEYGEGLTSHQVMVTPKGVSKINSLITEMENIEDEQYALEFGLEN